VAFDVRTLVAILGLSNLLQLLVLLLELRINRAYRGVGWWLLWNASVAAGLVLMLLRELPALRPAAILAQNSLIVFGLTAFYVGLMRFQGRGERRRLLAAVFTLYFLQHAIFTLVRDDIVVRASSFAVAIAFLSFLGARDLRAARTPRSAESARFVSLVLLAQGVFFLWRLAGILAGGPVQAVFGLAPFNSAPYLEGFVASNLLTFGVILMTNQRSRAELVETSDQMRALNAGLERRVAERTAELEQSNRELEAMVHSIAHDLRAPLRAVDGFASLLQSEHAAALDVEGRHLLGRVRAGASGMDHLIRDLVEYARVGYAPLGRARVDMSALVHTVYENVASEEERGRTRFAVTELPPATGDAALLRLALGHLLRNALTYSASRSEPRIDVSGSRQEGVVSYRVADNGVGFDAAHAGKIFGVFQKLHAQDGYDGTGIGLAIVKRVVERHGGRVWAEGAVGAGAAFSLRLPDHGDDDA
jgi:signal transduction histidine kinase